MSKVRNLCFWVKYFLRNLSNRRRCAWPLCIKISSRFWLFRRFLNNSNSLCKISITLIFHFCQKWFDQFLRNICLQRRLLDCYCRAFHRTHHVMLPLTLTLLPRQRPLLDQLTRNFHFWGFLIDWFFSFCLFVILILDWSSDATWWSTYMVAWHHGLDFLLVILNKNCWGWVIEFILNSKR